ncbi:hypothetical protein [Paraburkholderia silvatlantica]|uniref:Uncharacterized protein n=1 Tax=Paraburkholderia silvatlantica TaxID=321895 RepID=A0ABR6FNE5_9BURK|nr:hypothetical protein [Paraburkholderia silvatlantica]MBB2928944.1 hypothetical protein [Paraburkholderia silvatlantica]
MKSITDIPPINVIDLSGIDLNLLRGFSMHVAWHPRNHADPALVWLREAVAALSTGSMVSYPLE